MIIISTMLYSTKDYYHNKSTKQLEKQIKNSQIKIQILENQIQKYKKDAKNRKKTIYIVKKVVNPDCLKTKTKIIIKEKYKKIIMYNVHHQILQELSYAPYLPVSQLQTMMNKRFVLDDINFTINISNRNNELFKGIIFDKNKTKSIIRDDDLLEVKFDTK